MQKLTIVILNWNGSHFLKKFLPSILKFTNQNLFDVYVVDNCSDDDSVQVLQNEFPQVKLLVFDRNYGFAHGYHKALEIIKAEYYVLLNSDVEVTENWIEPILELMESDSNIAAAMPKIHTFNNNNHFEYAGAAGGYIDKFGFPFCRGRVLSNIEVDEGQYNDTCEIFWASGACMFVRASAYHEVGGLDSDFFAHMEEIDLCWRLKKMGYSIFYCADSLVYHVGGGTLPNNNPRKLYLNYRNSLFLLFKNIPRKKFCRTLFVRMILDGASSLVYLARFSFSFFFAVFKAHIHFYMAFGKLNKKRKAIRSMEKQDDVSMVYKKSIVYNFIVRKKTRFSDLPFNDGF